MTTLRAPSMGVSRNPMVPLTAGDMQDAPVLVPLRELAPEAQGLLVCRYNGEWLLREHWDELTRPGDVIEWYDVPGDSEDLRGILTVVAIAATIFTGNPAFLTYIAGIGNLVLGFFASPEAAGAESADSSPTYSTSLSGNRARLYQPIPKVCGRHKVTPPFAAQPYQEFEQNAEDANRQDQFYYALFAVGIGNHTIERVLIDDTPIEHFQDVLTSTYLPPGTPPSVVLPNVVTAPEVSNTPMLTSLYIGGFAACEPKSRAASIGIDVVAPRGLAQAASNGNLGAKTVSWRVEVRTINDFGIAQTPWAVLATETRTKATSTPQRWSNRYTIDPPARVEVRIVRTDVRDENRLAIHDIQWAGLRAYLVDSAPLNEHAAHYEIKMRASEQLSSLSQRNISIIAWGHARTWHPTTGWGPEVATRNPAWWLADLWTSTTWGEGYTDDRVDLPTLHSLSSLWAQRQDRFDYVFDSAVDAWDAAKLIARAGRARPFRRFGVMTLARDQMVNLPVTAFTPRNTVPESMSMSEQLPTRDTADGIIVEYFDNRVWDWLSVECPCPGVVEMTNPIIQRIPGVTGATHATREGLYEAASMLYRRRAVACTTEMQGMLVNYMAPVRWMPEIPGYGQSGDVTHWDSGTRVMGLSEPPNWTDSNYLTLITDTGGLTEPMPVFPGPTEWDVQLPFDPWFAPTINDGTRERTKFLFGPLNTADEIVKVSSISDGGRSEDGAQLYTIDAIVDDNRVHQADTHLLPGPGVIQDPVDPGGEVDPGGGSLLLVVLNNAIYSVNTPGTRNLIYRLRNDGQAVVDISAGPPPLGSHAFPDLLANQWLFDPPHEISDTSLYEAMVSDVSSGAIVGGDAVGVWLNLGTTREWVTAPNNTTVFRISIREASTGIVQATAIAQMTINNSDPGGGA